MLKINGTDTRRIFAKNSMPNMVFTKITMFNFVFLADYECEYIDEYADEYQDYLDYYADYFGCELELCGLTAGAEQASTTAAPLLLALFFWLFK